MAELGNDGNDMPGGLSMATWKVVGVVGVAMAVDVVPTQRVLVCVRAVLDPRTCRVSKGR